MGAKNTFKFSKIFFLILVFALGNFTTVFAQCGTDSSFEICTKETYNQGVGNADGVVDLFKILGGSPSVGGSWTDVSNSGGLDISSGLLDTWSVKRGGIYKYQYTNGACSATVTLTIGGYTGIKSKTYTGGTCNTINKLFLNGFLENNPTSDNNGTWTGGPVGTITGSSFDGTKIILPPGGSSSFNLTYTVSAIGNCPSRSTDVNFKVEAPSNPGTPIALEVCETDSFSSYTNLNLSSLITGYVSGGDWSDANTVITGEISDVTDSTINLKNIYNTFGSGVYKFSYTLSSGLYCDPGIATVQITIKPVIDLTGAILALSPKTVCLSTINPSTQIGVQIDSSKLNPSIPDGTYIITYTQTGINPKSATTINVTFSGGQGNFF